MATFRKCSHRAAGALVLGAVLLSGCSDRPSPAAPAQERPRPEAPAGTPTHLVAITCTADVAAGTLACGDETPPAELRTTLTVGGEGQFVKIRSGTATYANGVFTVPVSVQNLIPQPLGTADGSTLDGSGVRVFLESPPVVTHGTGSIATNVDGVGTFTATDQGFWQYNQILPHGTISGSRAWSFTMPGTVQGFRFTVYVSAVVPFPAGWIDLTPASLSLQPFRDLALTPTVVNALGMRIGGNPSITFVSSDTTLAAVSTSGLVLPKRAGVVQITATGAGVTGSAAITVLGMTRVWRGTVGTDWAVGENWEGGIAPVAADSVLIPNPAAGPHWPILNGHRQIAGVTVQNGANLSVGAFDLTATGPVTTGTTGGIVGPGRVLLAGIAQTVHGVLPRVRVSGTYSLSGNLTVAAPLLVEHGRITATSFRLQAQ